MTNNERELLSIIRDRHDPERAVEIALDLMIDFLTRREVPQDTSFEHRSESA